MKQGSPQLADSDFDIAAPHTASFVESLRVFGYELPRELADLVENSITVAAKNVSVGFHWDGENTVVTITDDGDGMSQETLVAATRQSNQNPSKPREPHDLGRFGLCLPFASFSQCRCVIVRSIVRSGKPATHCWDIDHIAHLNGWQVLCGGDAEIVFAWHTQKEQGGAVICHSDSTVYAATRSMDATPHTVIGIVRS